MLSGVTDDRTAPRELVGRKGAATKDEEPCTQRANGRASGRHDRLIGALKLVKRAGGRG